MWSNELSPYKTMLGVIETSWWYTLNIILITGFHTHLIQFEFKSQIRYTRRYIFDTVLSGIWWKKIYRFSYESWMTISCRCKNVTAIHLNLSIHLNLVGKWQDQNWVLHQPQTFNFMDLEINIVPHSLKLWNILWYINS